MHYDKRESVPTWDYIAIHAYGKASIIEDENGKMKALEQMINFYDQDYMEQWQGLPDKYKQGMIRGIVAFEIEVTDLQGQQKLSQNKTEKERERIIQHLDKSADSMERDLAPFIRNVSK
jgi:transcriptional regulator